MKIRILINRIEFALKKGQTKPEVFRLSGIGPTGQFVVEQQIMLWSESEKRHYCNLPRGIYAVFAFPVAFMVLLPERVRLTVAVAKELLGEQLPPERVLEDSIAAALSDLITKGAPWASATAMLGVTSNGRHKTSPPKPQPEEGP